MFKRVSGLNIIAASLALIPASPWRKKPRSSRSVSPAR
jgi:hypothetical protein